MTKDSAAKAIKPGAGNPFRNFNNAMLADELGDIEIALKTLEAREKAAREEMTRRKLNVIDGTRWIVVKVFESSMRFNSEMAKQKMGIEWYDGLKTEVSSTTYMVTPQSGAASPQAEAEALFRKADA